MCHSFLVTTTYWHIAHPTYTGGDLISRSQLAANGIAPEWAWDEAPEGFDDSVVCLFPNTPRGRTEADWLWYERQDHTLIRVEVPDETPITQVEEGYPAIEDRIPAAWCTTIRHGYAENTVTQEGDEY